MTRFFTSTKRFIMRRVNLLHLVVFSAISLFVIWWILAPLDVKERTEKQNSLLEAIHMKPWIGSQLDPDVQYSTTGDNLLLKIAQSGTRAPMTFKNGEFILNGQEIRFLSGAIHYFRVVPEYWEDRLYKLKAAGLNTVETYVAWNSHEEVKGQFNFDGILNIRQFVQTAEKLGLFVILRPGPYICTEWELGGFPSWLLRDSKMKVRSNYPPYMEAVNNYFSHLMAQLNDLQWSKGGPIVSVQIENEYGYYTTVDKNHIASLEKLLRQNGVTELLFTSDNKRVLEKGSAPGVLKTGNFKKKDVAKEIFQEMHDIQPEAPLVVSEFWTGWFDAWGDTHHTRDTKEMEDVLKYIIDRGASFNLYMFHGGTNFGFMNGANGSPGGKYNSLVTSYDYDAPLTEHGATTEKYDMVKNLLMNISYSYKDLPYPEPVPTLKYDSVKMDRMIGLSDLLSLVKTSVKAKEVINMEALDINNKSGQAYGYILYRSPISKGTKLTLSGYVFDRAQVFVDGKLVDIVNAQDQNKKLSLPSLKSDSILDILVENLGRKNYGHLDDQRKGLTFPVLVDDKKISKWEIFPLEFKTDFVESASKSNKWKTSSTDKGKLPALFRGTFEVDVIADTFLDMKVWRRGVVFINSINIGRYWDIGPQRRLYIPAPFLKKGKNEVLIFELQKSSSEVSFQDTPDIG